MAALPSTAAVLAVRIDRWLGQAELGQWTSGRWVSRYDVLADLAP